MLSAVWLETMFSLSDLAPIDGFLPPGGRVPGSPRINRPSLDLPRYLRARERSVARVDFARARNRLAAGGSFHHSRRLPRLTSPCHEARVVNREVIIL